MIIEPVRPQDLTRAFEHALLRVPDADRAPRVAACLALVDNGLLNPATIWVARTQHEITAVQVCVALSPSACLFWLPTSQTPTADLLVQAALDQARSQGCKLAQSFAVKDDEPWVKPLLRRGFRHITQLHQMAHSLAEVPASPASTLRYEPFGSALKATFAAMLERTYVQTLDCPELDGVRTIEEVIAGHQAQGTFHPDYWWLVYDGDKPIGVTLLAEMPQTLTWELAYFGLVPDARGRGHGRAMMLHAMNAVRRLPTIGLTLAVDARNVPARRLYDSLGFVEIERQEVLLYRW